MNEAPSSALGRMPGDAVISFEFFRFCLFGLLLLLPAVGQAQLVADGQTNVLMA